MNQNNKYLFIFTIGPVQSFIAQARKTQDLYAGSRLLSELVNEAMQEFDKEEEIIFPKKDSNNKSLPNRFIAKVNLEITQLKTKGKNVEMRVRKKWEKLALDTLKNRKLHLNKKICNAFDQQIEQHLDIHWAFYPLEGNYADNYKNLEKLLGSIKNVRSFQQYNYNGIGERGRKCSLDGKRNALFFGEGTKPRYFSPKWNPNAVELKGIGNSKVGENEGLSAVGFVKRFYHKGVGFPSTAKISLLYDEKQLEQNQEKGTQDCVHNYKKIFKENEFPLTCLEIKKQVKFTGGKLIKEFDYQFLYEENLVEKYIPNKNQLDCAKEVLPKIKKYFKARYYALVMFDGDKMGEWLSGKKLKQEYQGDKLEDFHKKFSKKLSNYASWARNYLEGKDEDKLKKGAAVYAGGDDFLGFVNLHYLFEVMERLREKFDKLNQELQQYIKDGEALTFSAGIVIAHYKTPLSEVLKTVRKVEKKAKEEGERNAFCITAMRHSGEIQEAVFKWDKDEKESVKVANWSALQHISEQLSGGVFSNKFISNLTVELYQLAGQGLKNLGEVQEQAISTEIKRLCKRALIKREKREVNQKHIEELSEQIELLSQNSFGKSRGIQNFIHSLHIADFISRKTR